MYVVKVSSDGVVCYDSVFDYFDVDWLVMIGEL